jgi:uncharacterized protein (DUF3084 family)
MVEDNSQQPPKTTIRQMLDIMADLISRQKDIASTCLQLSHDHQKTIGMLENLHNRNKDIASICRQLDWDNRELRLRVDALERQAEAYRRKYPIE